VKTSVALSAALVASGIFACKKSPPPSPPQELVTVVDAAPAADPMKTEAGGTFERRYSCPDDRVTVVPRPDIDPMQALASDRELKSATPPAALKNDPAGYAKWKQDQDAERERLHATYGQNTMFEVDGCGHMEIFACRPHRNGDAVYPDWAECLAARGVRETADRVEPAGAKP
jgi:hypothetical protein